MSAFDPQELVLRMFLRLRRKGFKLGVGEYMAALKMLDVDEFAADEDILEDTLKLLWCHSLAEHSQFDSMWATVQAEVNAQKRRKPAFPGRKRVQSRTPLSAEQEHQSISQRELQEKRIESPPRSELGSLPIQAPELIIEEEETASLQAYYPISRRSLVYNWRYLRRPIADGPMDVLDLDATIQMVTRQGFFLAPVYGRRERNDARLLLLIDQNGSMTPFHHFTRDLVETARDESSLDSENVRAFYFQNVPIGSVYEDSYLTKPVAFATVLGACDNNTSVLIVSDAGAARGFRTRERVRSTARFLYQLKQRTSLMAWLNPMPETRWEGSSAEIIANSIAMFQLDREGLNNAIGVVRGQFSQRGASTSL